MTFWALPSKHGAAIRKGALPSGIGLPSKQGTDVKKSTFFTSAQHGWWECTFSVISAKWLVVMYFSCDRHKTGGVALAWEQDGEPWADNATMR